MKLKSVFKRFVDPKGNIRRSYVFRNTDAGISAIYRWIGISPPWKSDEREYWRSRTIGDAHGPENYLQEDNSTHVMLDDLLAVLEHNSSFLEIGCNAGRNLNYLFARGYRDLAGIEINEASINTVLKKHFPDLYKNGKFYIGNALDQIKLLPDSSFDVIFSIGVLEHIPYEDKALFQEIARVARRYVAIITGTRSTLFNYNYEKIFNNYGFTTVVYRLFYGNENHFRIPVKPYNANEYSFDSMFLRIFIKNILAKD